MLNCLMAQHYWPHHLVPVSKSVILLYLEEYYPMVICVQVSAFPVLACVLLGPSTSLSTEIFMQSFSDYLSTVDYKTISDALTMTEFSSAVKSSIINIISRFGCTEIPTPKNLRLIMSNLAEHHFTAQPFAAICKMSSAIPDTHRPFWQSIGVEQLYSLIKSSIASPLKVLEILSEPSFENCNEERVFLYLQQYIGQMSCSEVNRFLRFVTGYSVLTGEHISVTFNTLSGIARQPIAHTCGYVLELYVSYLDFVGEFSTILGNDEYCWAMDST